MKKENKIKKYTIILLIVFLLLGIDQCFKIISINIEEGKVLIPEVLQFSAINQDQTIMNNRGMLILTDIVILIIILNFVITQIERMEKGTKIVMAIILAGGISNLIDKVLWGNIVNYINFTLIKEHIFKFNIAYICIFVGIFVFIGITVRNLTKKNTTEIEEV